MINSNLFLRIKNIAHMTNSEVNIAEYFKKVRTELAMENINSISNGANVSKATVTRFVKKLGYKDFAQFKNSLRRELFSNLSSPYQRYLAQKSTQNEKGNDPWTLTVEASIGDLKKALTLNSDKKIIQAAKILSTKKGRLFVIGQLASYSIAHYFQQTLNFLKSSFLLENTAGNLYRQLENINKDDVLFAISYQNYTQETNLVMQHFHEHSAKVVLLTDSKTSPPVQWSHLQLFAPTQWETMLISRCSCLMVVEGILSAMVRLTNDNVQKRVDEMWNLSDKFNIFTIKNISTQIQL